jgi:hypothetical protein
MTALSREFDLMLHKRQRRRPPSAGTSGGGTGRGPPFTPELDTIMDWLTAANRGAGGTSPSTTGDGRSKMVSYRLVPTLSSCGCFC